MSGREHVPPSGPCLVVSNHAGFADGPLVLSLAPRGITFLVKREMFASPVGPFLRLFGQIPVDRSRGDRTALGTALRVRKAGGAVVQQALPAHVAAAAVRHRVRLAREPA